jgi:hypothetical protein
MRREVNGKQPKRVPANEWAGTGWAEWPDADVDVDDEEFAAAIARGRELEAAA